jgi:hypothetical protein
MKPKPLSPLKNLTVPVGINKSSTLSRLIPAFKTLKAAKCHPQSNHLVWI